MLAVAAAGATASGCSIRGILVDRIGDALAEGGSVYETEGDLVLVEQALPFSLKLLETLLVESPRHRGLLLAACRGFTLYAYSSVHFDAERAAETDVAHARALRSRARALYLRALDHGLRGLEASHPEIRAALGTRPAEAVAGVGNADDVPFLYWSAAALGLAISVSRDDAAMLGRIPEVEALAARGRALDETFDGGAFHELELSLAASTRRRPDPGALRRHYERALELSGGKRASVHLAFAEAVSVPAQDREGFRRLVGKALAIDPDAAPEYRLANVLARRRAEWLLERIDELFLEEGR